LRQPLRTWLRVVARGKVVAKDRRPAFGREMRVAWTGRARRAGGWIGSARWRTKRSARRVRTDGARDIVNSRADLRSNTSGKLSSIGLALQLRTVDSRVWGSERCKSRDSTTRAEPKRQEDFLAPLKIVTGMTSEIQMVPDFSYEVGVSFRISGDHLLLL
jgi:hypothetical protein